MHNLGIPAAHVASDKGGRDPEAGLLLRNQIYVTIMGIYGVYGGMQGLRLRALVSIMGIHMYIW